MEKLQILKNDYACNKSHTINLEDKFSEMKVLKLLECNDNLV